MKCYNSFFFNKYDHKSPFNKLNHCSDRHPLVRLLFGLTAAWSLWLLGVAFFLPLIAGMVGVILPAWDYLPVLGL